MEKKLRQQYLDIKLLNKCQHQLTKRNERREQDGLPIYHKQMTFEQHKETNFSKHEAYDVEKHRMIIKQREAAKLEDRSPDLKKGRKRFMLTRQEPRGNMRYLNAAHTRAHTSQNTRNITKKEFVLEK